jgi:hypothetical protein
MNSKQEPRVVYAAWKRFDFELFLVNKKTRWITKKKCFVCNQHSIHIGPDEGHTRYDQGIKIRNPVGGARNQQ